MKKSPLSTPRSNERQLHYNWRTSHVPERRTGYNSAKSEFSQCASPNDEQTQSGNDFIPLGVSTPEHKKYSSNWNSFGGYQRNSGSGGFNHYRNNYHVTPKSHFNNSYSPYKHSGKQFYNQKKEYLTDWHKHTGISNYLDMKSFLEDPWQKLMKSNRSTEDELSQLMDIDSKSVSEARSTANLNNSCFGSESKFESSIEGTFSMDDTDVSDISRTESSVDLKLDSVRFSQESKNESVCSKDSASEDVYNENNICAKDKYSSESYIPLV